MGWGDSHGKRECGLVMNHLLADRWIHLSQLGGTETPPEIHSLVTHPLISDPLGIRDPAISKAGTFLFLLFDPLQKSHGLSKVIGSRFCLGFGGRRDSDVAP